MRKRIVFIMATVCALLITGCGASNSEEDPAGTDNQIKVMYVENAEQTDAEENISIDGVADYPAAIMVNDTVYLVEGTPMPAEVDESAIIGYTESYTDTFPENSGETNFNPELGMPYAQVEGGIAVLYKNEWYLGTPFSCETQEPAKDEDWEDKALLEEYAANGIEKDGDFYCYQSELVYIIKNQYPGSSVYSLNTDSTGTISIKVIWNAKGEITSVSYLTEEEVAKALPKILGGMGKERDTNTDVSSPLDGVTMEVTECSDTSVTVRIVNVTDKDIQCGEDFCLETQDEETGEWQELDEVIDNAAFNAIAYMIQKDSPYETVIDLEWLYGGLETGRYRIVKTVTDFRGIGDYTDYVFTAEFNIE